MAIYWLDQGLLSFFGVVIRATQRFWRETIGNLNSSYNFIILVNILLNSKGIHSLTVWEHDYIDIQLKTLRFQRDLSRGGGRRDFNRIVIPYVTLPFSHLTFIWFSQTSPCYFAINPIFLIQLRLFSFYSKDILKWCIISILVKIVYFSLLLCSQIYLPYNGLTKGQQVLYVLLSDTVMCPTAVHQLLIASGSCYAVARHCEVTMVAMTPQQAIMMSHWFNCFLHIFKIRFVIF